MEIPLLNDIIIIFVLSIAVLFLFNRLRMPALVGFLVTGILAGPHGLGLIKAVHEVEIMAEIGVVLLLFTIGMEFSLTTLSRIKKSILLGGTTQVFFTLVVFFALALQMGRTVGESLFIGFLVSLSSTAIVLRLFQERAEMDSPHGQTSLAILIFQDMIVVPMMLLTPILAGIQGNIGLSLIWLFVKGCGIIVLVIVGAKWIAPPVFYQIARTRSRELFLLSVVVLCFSIALFTSSMGLSLALGAFLAGLVISESEYSYQALGNILPFRDVFMSFFFVSVGMLLNVGFLVHNISYVLPVVLLVLALKACLAGFGTLLLGFPLRTAIIVGLTLCQVGEFSFILAWSGVNYGLLAGGAYQLFLAVSILTMAVTPFMTAIAPRIAGAVMRMPFPLRLKAGLTPQEETKLTVRKDHLVIIGFGLNGRNLHRTATMADIAHVIIEMNPETVRQEKAAGKPIFYGDATQEPVLHHAGIDQARVVVVAISDAAATRRITEIVRRMNPLAHVITRTRFLKEMKPLYELGANEVVPEEFETSVEIFSRVLKKYLMPREEIEKLVAEVRSDGYQMLRSLSNDPSSFSELNLSLPDVEISTFRVCKQSPVHGKTLGALDLRKKHGVSILAIRRGDTMLSNPGAEMQLMGDDVVVALGAPEIIAMVIGMFRNQEEET